MHFKFRKKEYEVTREARQFTLSEKMGDAYVPVGYYHDPYYLVQKLLSLHLLSANHAKEISTTLKSTCKELGDALKASIKDNSTARIKRSCCGQYQGSGKEK